MKNTKGFTLVELLAVIVILAIVALVTTPAILNVVNNARKSGAEDKTWGTIDAVKLAYTQAQSDGYNNEAGTGVAYATDTGKITVTYSATVTQPVFTFTDSAGNHSRKVTLNGEHPYSGKIYIDTIGGEITAEDLIFEKNGMYVCATNATGDKACCKTATARTATYKIADCK